MTLIDFHEDILADAVAGTTHEPAKDPVTQQDKIWRMAMIAVTTELTRRGIKTPHRAAGKINKGLPILFPPVWAARSTDELLDFYNHLIVTKP
jgi:hypothetical protein